MRRYFVFLLFIAAVIWMFSCENTIDQKIEGDDITNAITSDNTPDESVIHPAKWRTVTNVKGKNNKKTSVFEITGEHWKVEWDVADEDNSEFIIMLVNKEDPEDIEMVAQEIGSSHDFEEWEGGQGKYYLQITSKSKYKVSISEYK